MGTLECKVAGAAEREETLATARDEEWLKTAGDTVESGEALDSVLPDELESR